MGIGASKDLNNLVYFCNMKIGMWTLVLLLLMGCNSSPTPYPENDPLAPTNFAEGKEIFTTKCASCHRINVELTGPALKGVEDRWPDKQKLFDFIRNSTAVIETDAYAYDLWLKFNQTQMTLNPDLTDAQIQSVLDYIKSVTGK
jgi:mono/diheme cytochrome c family protein